MNVGTLEHARMLSGIISIPSAERRAQVAEAIAQLQPDSSWSTELLACYMSVCLQAAPVHVSRLIAPFLAGDLLPQRRCYLLALRGRGEVAARDRRAAMNTLDELRALIRLRPGSARPDVLAPYDSWSNALSEIVSFTRSLAWRSEEEGDLEAAATAFRAAIDVGDGLDSVEGLGRVCFGQGRFEEAELLLRRYVRFQMSHRRSDDWEQADPTTDAQKLLDQIVRMRTASTDEPAALDVGDTVSHAKFGRGIVLSIQEGRVRIRFDSSERTLLASSLVRS